VDRLHKIISVDFTQIQHAIAELPAEEQTALAWIADRDRTRWDEEIARDFSPGGAGMDLLDKVTKQVRDGLSPPFPKAALAREFPFRTPPRIAVRS
jgi:hypothetical protein